MNKSQTYKVPAMTYKVPAMTYKVPAMTGTILKAEIQIIFGTILGGSQSGNVDELSLKIVTTPRF